MLTEEKAWKAEFERIIGESLGEACPEKVAATAIAKGLSEGVIWSGNAVTKHSFFDNDYSCPLTLVTMPDGEFEIAHHHKGIDGQLVSVTVKIVEGTKDESQS